MIDSYTFDTLTTLPYNSDAVSAAHAFAANRSSALVYYVWGNTGLGKTHLINAIAHAVNRNAGTFLGAERLMFSSLHPDRRREALEHLSTIEALALEALPFLSDKPATQSLLAEILVRRRTAGLRTAIDGCCALDSIPTFHPALRNALEGALDNHLLPLNAEERLILIEHHATKERLNLAHSTMERLARRLRRCPRELQGVLRRTAAKASLEGIEPDAVLRRDLDGRAYH